MSELVKWLREEAPWAVQHLWKRVGPEKHQTDAAAYLVTKSAEAADEIERLRAGGCARDQSTTQFCAIAVAAEARVKELEGVFSNLDYVIEWLRNGCDPQEAAKELAIYRDKIAALSTAHKGEKE
jgi:hypothetical protein